MESLLGKLNLYMIPPALSLLVGVTISLLTLSRGRRNSENIIYSLMFFWSVLTGPVFICHHFFWGNIPLIMTIDRFTHFIYVYAPSIGILFTHTVVHHRNRLLVISSFIISFILSLFTFSDYYIAGLWEYSWGYMAKPGIAFQVMGVHAISVITYSIVMFIRAAKRENDELVRLKYRYLMVSMALVGLLTTGNMPATAGIDSYPIGNFIFIPLLFMAWGIFRHDVIRINMYTKRRILGVIFKILVTAGFLVMIPAGIWALEDERMADVLGRTLRYGIPPLVSLVFCTIISVLSLRLGENKRESFLFSVIMMFHSFLSLDIYINSVISNPETGLSVSRFDHIFVAFIPALYLHLVNAITGISRRRWILYACYAIGLGLALSTQSGYYIQGMYEYSWGFFAKKSVLFDVMSALTAFTVVYGGVLLIAAFRKETNPFLRHRLRYLLFGMISTGVLYAGNFPAMHGIDIYPTGNFIFIPAVFFAIGMLRYNITGMISFARSAAVYIGMAVSLILIALAHEWAGFFRNMPAIARVPIIVLMFLRLRRLWILTLDRFFPRQSDVLRTAFAGLVSELEKIHGFAEMGRTIANRLFRLVLSRNCTILLYSREMREYYGAEVLNPVISKINEAGGRVLPRPSWVVPDHPLLELFRERRAVMKQADMEEWLLNRELAIDKNDLLRLSEIVLPVFFEDRLLALILLGPKIDGSVYSRDELTFLL